MRQLDLFDLSTPASSASNGGSSGAPPSGAAIVCFPQHRNVGKARHTALLLLQKEGKSREAYWRQVCKGLTASMKNAHIKAEEIERQLLAFRHLVSAEMSRLSSGNQRQPGGAA